MKTLIKITFFFLPLTGMTQDRSKDSIQYNVLVSPILEKQRILGREYSAKSNALQRELIKINKEFYVSNPDSEIAIDKKL